MRIRDVQKFRNQNETMIGPKDRSMESAFGSIAGIGRKSRRDTKKIEFGKKKYEEELVRRDVSWAPGKILKRWNPEENKKAISQKMRRTDGT